MTERIVTVFGGTGFLGRAVVRHLRSHGFAVRAASRHPRHARLMFGNDDRTLQSVEADVSDGQAVAAALAGAWAAVNAVSLYVERGAATFHAIHVEGARDLALAAKEARIERLVHVSGIGASTASPSLYVRKRAEGEEAVRAAFPATVVVRPGAMFGVDGGIVKVVLDVLRRLPVYPLFGRGQTRMQPSSVKDVAESIVRVLMRPQPWPPLYEFGGPSVFSYEEFIRTVAHEAGVRARLFPFPFGAWHALAGVAEFLPHPPVTRNQVELMEVDTVTSPGMPGFKDLGIEPQPVEETVRRIVHGNR